MQRISFESLMEQSQKVDKMKTKLIVTLLILISFVMPLSIVSAESYNLQISFAEDVITAAPGNQGYITLELRNAGSSTIEGISIVANTADYSIIKSLGTWEKSLGDLSPGSSISTYFYYDVSSSAEEGLYELSFKVKTTNAGYHTRYLLMSIEEPESLDIVSLSPSYLDIGEKTTMTLTVANNGNIDITNVLFTWEDEYTYILPVGTDNRMKITTVPANDTVDILFDVLVSPSLPAGVYPLYITLDYKDHSGQNQTVHSQIGVQIGGATEFEVVVEDSSGSSTTLAIANTGANTASSVIVKIPDQVGYTTSGSNSVNLGNLDAGDYTLATFQLTQTSTSTTNSSQFPFGNRQDFNMSERPSFNSFPDNNMTMRPGFMDNNTFPETIGAEPSSLLIEISYTDLFGIRQTEQVDVPLSSTSSMSSSQSFTFDRSASGQFSGMSSTDSTSGLDTGTMYIIAGILGIILIITVIKFNTIKTLPKKIKARKGKKHENQ